MRQIATSYITAHKEWHCPKKPCMACTTFLILFTDVWIFLTVRRGQQNERNDNRSGNPYQVLSSSYSMFMTLSFATSPFSSTRDFLFASDAVDPVQSFIDRRYWYNIVRLVTLRIFLQVLEGSVNLLDSMCEDEVLTSTLISMLSCWGT